VHWFEYSNPWSDNGFIYFADPNLQTFPSSEVNDKINGGSRPSGDADGKCYKEKIYYWSVKNRHYPFLKFIKTKKHVYALILI